MLIYIPRGQTRQGRGSVTDTWVSASGCRSACWSVDLNYTWILYLCLRLTVIRLLVQILKGTCILDQACVFARVCVCAFDPKCSCVECSVELRLDTNMCVAGELEVGNIPRHTPTGLASTWVHVTRSPWQPKSLKHTRSSVIAGSGSGGRAGGNFQSLRGRERDPEKDHP